MSIEDRWVPVTACKYPHRNGCYILSLKSGEVVFAEFCRVGIDDKPRWYEVMPICCSYGQEQTYYSENDVEAWMPMPQPYKKGGN